MILTSGRDAPPAAAPDADEDLAVLVRKVKNILTTMANAVSAMKIFPSDHETVRNFVALLGTKFDDIFERTPTVQVDVTEYSFVYAGQVVYTDETPGKSLPFFFFKDGMEILYFYRGLERRELFEFLELVKSVSQMPAEDNDIVAALWKSDFSNIQYYAPDEFLENQILAEKREAEAKDALPGLPSDLAHETLEVRVDRTKHAVGRIVLEPADRERLAHGPESPGLEGPPSGSGLAGPSEPHGEPSGAQPLSARWASDLSGVEVEELEGLVRANRLLWPEEELVNLTAEIVFLEEDPTIGAASLDILGDFYVDQIRAGQFPVAALVIRRLRELRSQVPDGDTEKASLIDASLKDMSGPRALAALDAGLGPNVNVGWPAVIAFFRLLGTAALPAAAGVFERLPDPELRTQILDFIRDLGWTDPEPVARLASDARPCLTLEIIGFLSELPEEKAVPAMSVFLGFKSRDIKLEAIHALARRTGEEAGRILFGFLDDPDDVIRLQAALRLDRVGERSRILLIIGTASAPEFRKRSFKEKLAFLSLLGRTRSPEALAFLAAALAKTNLWPSRNRLEMRLAAVAGLEAMGTAEARVRLEAGRHIFNKQVRRSCAEALDRMSTSMSRRR